MTRTKKPNPRKDALFLQGFATGFCACLDLVRDKGLEGLPNGFCRAMVGFADETETRLKSDPEWSVFLKWGATPEARAAVLKALLSSVEQPAPATLPDKETK